MADPIERVVNVARLKPGKAAARLQVIIAFIAGLFVLGLLVEAQEKSLADIARESKAKKASAKTPAKVYTDDNLPKSSTAASSGNSTPSESAKADEKNTTAAADASKPMPANENNPEEWRTAIYKQKKTIADLEADVNRLERDNRTFVAENDSDKAKNLPRMSCSSMPGTYSGYGCTSIEDGSPSALKRKEYDKQHDAKQADLAAARKRLDDLQQEARKRGINVQ